MRTFLFLICSILCPLLVSAQVIEWYAVFPYDTSTNYPAITHTIVMDIKDSSKATLPLVTPADSLSFNLLVGHVYEYESYYEIKTTHQVKAKKIRILDAHTKKHLAILRKNDPVYLISSKVICCSMCLYYTRISLKDGRVFLIRSTMDLTKGTW